MVALDASRRISAADALQHRYFRTDPLPSSLDQLPKPRQRGAEPAAAAAAGAQPDVQQQEQAGQQQNGDDSGAGGAAEASSAGQQQQQQQQQQGGPPLSATPLFGGRSLDRVPESLLGRIERPKLDSADLTFFKKRKFNLDDALEEGEGGGGGE